MDYKNLSTAELQALFVKHNELYYNPKEGDLTTIPDSEFDKLALELASREQNNGAIKQLTTKVNSELLSTSENVIHGSPMLSLQTVTDYSAFGFTAFDSYLRTLLKVSKEEPLDYVCEPKYDGLGLSLQYNKGSLINIVTRGDGVTGTSVMYALNRFNSRYLPTQLPEPFTGEVRGEGMMTISTFKDQNDQLEVNGFKKKVNPRNAVAGLVRAITTNIDVAGSLIFFPYAIPKTDKRFMTQMEVLDWFRKVGFRLYKGLMPKLYSYPVKGMSSPYDYHKNTNRDSLDIEIDGVVYKLNSLEKQLELGYREREPRWAAAHKFPPNVVMTKLLSVDITFGRTGVVTPVAKLEPVFVGGVTVSSCILENFFHIRKLGLRIGDNVELVRAGDTIPKIQRAIPSRSAYVPNIRAPKTCPYCGTEVVRNHGMREHRCPNVLCDNRLKLTLVNFASRDYMDIQGLGEETIEKLFVSKRIRFPEALYNLSIDDLVQYGGMAMSNALKAHRAINDSLKREDWVLLSSLGIPSVGRTVSKKICSELSIFDLSKLLKPNEVSSKELDDLGVKIGEVSAIEKLKEYFKCTQLYIEFTYVLEKFEKTLIISSTEKKASKGTIVLTGGFAGGRKFISKELEKLGWTISSSVGSKTNYLIVGASPTQHKVETAQKLQIPVVSLNEFINI